METRTSREVEVYRDNMEARMTRMETIMQRVEANLVKLNDRTYKLESWKNWITGAMAVVAFAITIIIGCL